MLRPGALVGSLRIEAIIGRGAMGEVFRATQLTLKRQVAVKRIAEHLLETPEALARFEREAQVLARIQSPYVVAVHDYGRMRDDQGQEHYLLVMELVEGARTLRSCVERTLPWPEATALVLQAARGLAAAAEFAVVHRDIKPHNIIVSSRGIAKLADFGLARSGDSTDLTSQGMVLGTPAYMAPEACRSEPVDGRSDLYSLGVTWFQLLCGRTPFLADNTPAMLRAQVDDPPPRIEQLVPDLPPRIAELVHRLLQKQPKDRPASAVVLVELLQGLHAEGLQLPDVVTLPGSDGLSADPTTAATRMDAGMPRTATLTAAMMGGEPTAMPAAADVSRTAATILTSPPAPLAAPPPARQHRRGPLLLAGLLLLAGVLGGGLWWRLHPTPARAMAAISAAMSSGDLTLALALADQAVQAYPGDTNVRAAASQVVGEEVSRKLAGDGPEAARALLAKRAQALPWLDDEPFAILIECDEADRAAALTRKREQKEEAYAVLFKHHPQDPVALERIVHALVDDDESDLVILAAVHLAQAEDRPSAQVQTVLRRAQRTWAATSPLLGDVRTQLLRHWPDCTASASEDLLSPQAYRREGAYLLLEQAGALTPALQVGFQIRNLLEFDTNATAFTTALDYLEQQSAAPGWPKLVQSSSIPRFTACACLASSLQPETTRVRHLLEHAFPAATSAALPVWIADTKQLHLRWNAWLMYQESGLAGGPAAFEFHAQTLQLFDEEGPEEDAEAAFTYFASLLGTPDAPRAELALRSCQARITDSLARYRDNPRLALHVRFVQETLDRVTALHNRFALPTPAR